MPRRKPDEAYLWDMLSAGREVVSFVHGRTWSDYETTVGLRRQVERSVEIIGEAARHVSDELKLKHPSIPRSKITRQRHRLAHDYDLIDHEIICRVATIHVPEMIRHLEPLVPSPPADPLPER